MSAYEWTGECGVCGSLFGWPRDGSTPGDAGTFCPQCRANGLTASGVVHFSRSSPSPITTPAEVEALRRERDALNTDALIQAQKLLERTTACDTLRTDNSRLREALRNLYQGYVSTLEIGRDRIIALGGSCDPVDVMENGDPCLIAARATLKEPTP
jgi:hypothetical protein